MVLCSSNSVRLSNRSCVIQAASGMYCASLGSRNATVCEKCAPGLSRSHIPRSVLIAFSPKLLKGPEGRHYDQLSLCRKLKVIGVGCPGTTDTGAHRNRARCRQRPAPSGSAAVRCRPPWTDQVRNEWSLRRPRSLALLAQWWPCQKTCGDNYRNCSKVKRPSVTKSVIPRESRNPDSSLPVDDLSGTRGWR